MNGKINKKINELMDEMMHDKPDEKMDPKMEQKMDSKAVYRQELLAGGLVMGVLYSLQQIVIYAFNIENVSYGGIFFMYGITVIATVQVLFARKVSLSRPAQRGFSYGSALGFAVMLSMLAGIIVGIVNYIIMNVLDPTLGQAVCQQAYDQAVAMMPTVTDSQADSLMSMSRFMSNTIFGLIISSVCTMLLNGVFIGFITSVFVKRNADFFAQNKQ